MFSSLKSLLLSELFLHIVIDIDIQALNVIEACLDIDTVNAQWCHYKQMTDMSLIDQTCLTVQIDAKITKDRQEQDREQVWRWDRFKQFI